MRHLFGFILAVLLPMAAWADDDAAQKLQDFLHMQQQESAITATLPQATAESTEAKMVSVPMAAEPKLGKPSATRWAAGSVPAKLPVRTLSKAAPAINGGLTSARYMEFDYGADGATRTVGGMPTFYRTATNSVILYNLWGTADTIGCHYIEGTGALTMHPQLVYKHKTYGDIYLVSLNFEQKTYSADPSTVISAQVNDDGSITLHNWGLLVVGGKYAGGAFTTNVKSEFRPMNATATATIVKSMTDGVTTDSTATYEVYIDQTLDNQIDIYNFAGNGALVSAQLSSSKSVSIAPTTLFNNLMYGAFKCYPATLTEKGAKRSDGYIESVSADESKIELGVWGVFNEQGTTMAQLRKNTIFTLKSDKISYPAPKPLSWTGEGTSANPYVIKTAEQWLAFAESVNSGESYAGKYVSLGADVSFTSALQGTAYRPVGLSQNKPFSGTFDGQGYTLSGLTLAAGGAPSAGLFGYMAKGSALRNLLLDSISITSTGTYAGSAVGYSLGDVESVLVSNATITCTGQAAGGVVGYQERSNLSNCDMSKGTITGAGSIGGIAGYTGLVHVTACSSSANLDEKGIASAVYRGAGGVVGTSISCQLTKCYFSGVVRDESGHACVGGVVGSSVVDTISQCYNVGLIYGVAYTTSSENTPSSVGGVAGNIFGTIMSDCYNSNMIMNTQVSDHVGGLIGCVSSPTSLGTYASTVTNCYNSGQVMQPKMQTTQGLYGYSTDVWGTPNQQSVFSNCWYDVQINGYTASINDSVPAYAKLTADLTSGTLEGFSTSKWVFTKGFYPYLKGMKSSAQALSIAPLTLTDRETTKKVKQNFKVSVASSVNWRIIQSGGKLVTSDSVMTISAGGTVTLAGKNATEMLVASNDGFGTLTKFYTINTVDPSGWPGSGTKTDPYLISTLEDLENLNTAVVDKQQDFMGDYFVQTNDIDCNYSTAFTGIGNQTQNIVFSGTYDGQNHKILRMNLDKVALDTAGKAVSTGSYRIMAFIHALGADGTLKNLRIDSTCRIRGWSNMAGLVAYNLGHIEGCRNYADVTTVSSYAGGIAAAQNTGGIITGCYNSGTITTGGSDAAGIVVASKGDVIGCQNDGRVQGTIVNALNKSKYFNEIGGIVGTNMLDGTKICGNLNTGTVRGALSVGGIAFQLYYSMANNFTGNLNYGTIETERPDQSRYGALVGRDVSNNVESENNYYDAQLGYYGAAGCAPAGGLNGLLTRELTSGKPLAGLPEGTWDYKTGQYPVLAAFADEPAAQAARRMVVTLDDKDNADDINTAGTLADSVTWTLADGSQFKIAGGKLNLNAMAENGAVRDTLTATLGGYTKVIPLRSQVINFQGRGTQDDPYQIRDIYDMQALARYTNDDAFAFSGRHFRVMNDIDWDTVAYDPVAITPMLFNAEFDGGGKKFINVNYEAATGVVQNRALFGGVGDKGSIHDLTLESGSISCYGQAAGFVSNLYGSVARLTNKAAVSTLKTLYAAGIVNNAYASASITDCHNQGKITSAGTMAAGIVNLVEAGTIVKNCDNDGAVTAKTSYSSGIVGASEGGIITECVNRGTVAGTSYVAGIVANASGGDSIAYCHNEGTLSPTSYPTAGILAFANKATGIVKIEHCYNSADITSPSIVAGVAGTINGYARVTDCYNTGNLTCTGTYGLGGVLGDVNANDSLHSVITGCWNSGTIIGKRNVGGLAYDIADDVIVTDCYNTGSLLCEGDFAGGIGSRLSGQVTRCWNSGNIESAGYGIGGLGGIGTPEMRDCFNLGNITTSRTTAPTYGGTVGGVFGYGQGHFYSCYNMGTVTGNSYVGGFIGGAFDDLQLHQCFNAGKIVASTSTQVGGLVGQKRDTNVIDSCFYDAEESATNIADQTGAMTRRQLVSATQLGTDFNYIIGRYPTLKGFENHALAQWFAATVVLAEGDTPSNVAHEFQVGVPDSTQWTVTSNLLLSDDGQVALHDKGPATLTKTFGSHSRTYQINVTAVTDGIDQPTKDVPVLSTALYDLQGRKVAEPQAGNIYVRIVHYADGTTRSEKVMK